jgi:hypothetical protein
MVAHGAMLRTDHWLVPCENAKPGRSSTLFFVLWHVRAPDLLSIEILCSGAKMKNQEVASRSSRALAIKRPTLPMEVKPTKRVTAVKMPKVSVAAGNELDEVIRRKAYSIYESRQCEGGHALDDWLQAEAQTKIASKSVP